MENKTNLEKMNFGKEPKQGTDRYTYWLKLVNDEKFLITKEEYNWWRHWRAGDIVVITSKNGNVIEIPRRNIIFGFQLDNPKWEGNG